MWNTPLIRSMLARALGEDIGTGDLTTECIFSDGGIIEAKLIAKAEGVIAGLPLAQVVFQYMDPGSQWEPSVSDGARVCAGQLLARVRGQVRQVLEAERVALNFMQRMSGIATTTASYVAAVADLKTKIVDTRKTTPGMRVLEKYAVRVGGGGNHRFGLYDAVLIKDNHIAAAGGIAAAVERVRPGIPLTSRIEVEVESLEQADEALKCGVDLIMLDNMDTATMRQAVEMIAGRAKVEASGGINLATVREVALTGVDYISIGRLTHSVMALDISMRV